jgi:very-short-patch-repair endonuclease
MFKDRAPKPKPGGIQRARKQRRAMTLPEVLLWRLLRQRPYGLKFRRQHETGPYVLDFYCLDARLAIEIDGLIHDQPEQVEHDARRNDWFANHGIDTLRVPASEVLADVTDAAEAIVNYARAPSPSTTRLRRAVPLPETSSGRIELDYSPTSKCSTPGSFSSRKRSSKS